MKRSLFHLNKWFLDFIGENGETMIFYAAHLRFRGLVVQYGSWIHRHPTDGLEVQTHYRGVKLPLRRDALIVWQDKKFKVQGSWEATTEPIQARLFEEEGGYLDWHGFQPASKVSLTINGRVLQGKGYAEQLILTAFPWRIPMDDLRWGRFHSPKDTIVWIELRQAQKQQWLWLNGERMEKVNIEDDQLRIEEKQLLLKLDRSVVLESENKIFHVVEQLLHFIPGFKLLVPSSFLMAINQKWLSEGELHKNGNRIGEGWAIHEWVNFNP